ncbi:retinol dehydrogenase 11-like [Pollicipes pollicipes]|uniref:retinol dehydrogenase 11-like n=1 Tax=Pollicipes pollicipes TaxID=41117 RepID=UPI001885A176|nr:retinol dehydrogenase 11-like [Pollicipes pollicipes]XP_037075976.1 retinol dehydrogenase 11-like [Pollicipes pollicipes]XP_037075977.1 retinol dehydrogenase 11-like [Pollicipes pollicipes]XP_037075978.1 retinol dehydrogenase 11-like [Pollicipes pollicipes]
MPWKPMYRSDVRLEGKTVVITGANTGIGKEAARDLYGRGARVIMAVRTVSRGEAAREEIEAAAETGAGQLEVRQLDLESLESVRRCAEELNAAVEKIDLLILNAGKMACPRSETKDGFESQLGTNHLGHFLLTHLLLDKVKAAAPSRIIVLSSLFHKMGSMHFDDLQLKNNYGPWKAYNQSKLANVLFASELARRLKDSGVTTYAVHPGWVRTELARHLSVWTKAVQAPVQFLAKSPLQGVQTTLYCALEPTLSAESGQYYADCRRTAPSSRAQSVEDARRLWEVSEQLVGLNR